MLKLFFFPRLNRGFFPRLKAPKKTGMDNLTPVLYTVYKLCLLFNLYILYLHKQPHRADVPETRRRNVPAAGACRLPAHLQRNVVPPIREQGRESLPGMDAPSIEQQTRMRIGVCRIGEMQLGNPIITEHILSSITSFIIVVIPTGNNFCPFFGNPIDQTICSVDSSAPKAR